MMLIGYGARYRRRRRPKGAFEAHDSAEADMHENDKGGRVSVARAAPWIAVAAALLAIALAVVIGGEARTVAGAASERATDAEAAAAEAAEARREAEAARERAGAAEAEARAAIERFGAAICEIARAACTGDHAWRDCSQCPLMVTVQAGEFRMGGPLSEGGRDNERPIRPVTIARPFAIGKYEVTHGEWRACVDDRACDAARGGGTSNQGDMPATDIGWNDAMDYVDWLSKLTQRQYALASETEWEYAARAGQAARYHTGERITTEQANFDGLAAAPPGSFAANAFGLHDVHGNVKEWVADCYRPYPDASPARQTANRLLSDEQCGSRVVRGGSWRSSIHNIRSAYRERQPADVRSADIGFRVARRFDKLGGGAADPAPRSSESVVASLEVGDVFRDNCAACPEMVVLPAGSFDMGSEEEEGRSNSEGPVRHVEIGEPFAVGVHEVTRGEFAYFVSATNRKMGDSCLGLTTGLNQWQSLSGASWRSPGFLQSDGHPVVCVTWEDAVEYADWLSEVTDRKYRLLSESEWEYAARAGAQTAWYWGAGASDQCGYANGAALETTIEGKNKDCSDRHARTAPVGAFGANDRGLYDMAGNVREWTQDCWNGTYEGAPSDGGAWEEGDCSARVRRGGSWHDSSHDLRAAARQRQSIEYRGGNTGFRVARTLTEEEVIVSHDALGRVLGSQVLEVITRD